MQKGVFAEITDKIKGKFVEEERSFRWTGIVVKLRFTTIGSLPCNLLVESAKNSECFQSVATT